MAATAHAAHCATTRSNPHTSKQRMSSKRPVSGRMQMPGTGHLRVPRPARVTHSALERLSWCGRRPAPSGSTAGGNLHITEDNLPQRLIAAARQTAAHPHATLDPERC